MHKLLFSLLLTTLIFAKSWEKGDIWYKDKDFLIQSYISNSQEKIEFFYHKKLKKVIKNYLFTKIYIGNLDKDRSKEIVFLEHSEGMKCCSFLHIVKLNKYFKDYKYSLYRVDEVQVKKFKEYPYPLIVTQDDQFYNFFTDPYYGIAPKVATAFRNGKLKVIPKIMKKYFQSHDKLEKITYPLDYEHQYQLETILEKLAYCHYIHNHKKFASIIKRYIKFKSKKDKKEFLQKFKEVAKESPFW